MENVSKENFKKSEKKEIKRDKLTFEKIRNIATFEQKNGTTKEVNIISWNDAEPKFDFRTWYSDGKMTKGLTLTIEEFKELLNKKDEILANLEDIEKYAELKRLEKSILNNRK